MWVRFGISLALSLASAAISEAAKLPHFAAGDGAERAAALREAGQWSVHLGDQVYHAPPSESGLSSRVGDYYYAFGSDSALSAELQERRVGGQGRLHVFHLPGGPSMLQLGEGLGSRRKALSAMKQLKDGMEVTHTFPVYELDSHYTNPLDQKGQKIEKLAVSKLSAAGVMSILREITSFGTRSWRSTEASAEVQSFLQKKFADLGFTTCLNKFRPGASATNVVAYAPGSSGGSELTIIGAHYDDRPSYGPAPGAEDNGSGLAALLAIMKAFKETGVKTKQSVAFVAFAGEEPGLLGSGAYASAILTPNTNMELCLPHASSGGFSSFLHAGAGRRTTKAYQAIIMDEVGWQSPALDRATVNLESYDWTKNIMDNLVHASKDHNGESLQVVHSNHPFGSDHMSFLHRHVPAVLTINGDDEAYPFYHTSGDEITQVTGSLVAKIAKMNMGGLLRLAGVDSSAATLGNH